MIDPARMEAAWAALHNRYRDGTDIWEILADLHKRVEELENESE